MTGTALGQQRIVEQTFEIGSKDKVELDLKFGNTITVTGWDKETVSFRAVIEINGGRLNDALLLDFDEQQDELGISADFDEDRTRQGRRGDCPDRRYASYFSNDDNGSYSVLCSDITYQIMVPEGIDLRIESISSDIELIGVTGPIRAKSISGFVDLSWPAGAGAELSMETVTGEVYSGLDNLKLLNKKESAPLVGYKLRGSLLNGGALVQLESVSGNIYLRKMP